MRIGPLAAVAVLGLCGIGASAPARHAPRTHTVTIEHMRFAPESLNVRAGDTIVWMNKDLVPHTATSTPAGFDSKIIQADTSWKYTVHKKGAYTYTCTFHPTMTGRVRVR